MDSLQDKHLIYRLGHWATVGRLTASLFHEINNPMQAIRGATSLALEDLDDVESLRTYLELSLHESDRILSLIARARRVFTLDEVPLAPLDLHTAVSEVLHLAAKDMSSRRVTVNLQLAPALPPLLARHNEFSLALLSALFAVSDVLFAGGGGELTVRSTVNEGFVLLELSAAAHTLGDADVDLFVCRHLVERCQGYVEQLARDGQWTVCLALPQAA